MWLYRWWITDSVLSSREGILPAGRRLGSTNTESQLALANWTAMANQARAGAEFRFCQPTHMLL